MEFAITIETETEAGDKWKLIQALSVTLKALLADKNYGMDVQKCLIEKRIVENSLTKATFYNGRFIYDQNV